MTRTNSRLQSGKSLGFFAQFAKRWAITTIERQSIRQKAAALIAPKEKK
jgi:hypothetical protein